MTKTEKFKEQKVKAYKRFENSLSNIERKELSYLRNCIKNDVFDTEWFEEVEESGLVEIGVGVDCAEFTLFVSVGVELVKEYETNYSQLNIIYLQIDNIFNLEGNQIEWCEKTEQTIINKLK